MFYRIAGNFRWLKISDKVEPLLGIKFRMFNFRSFEICTILYVKRKCVHAHAHQQSWSRLLPQRKKVRTRAHNDSLDGHGYSYYIQCGGHGERLSCV